MNYWTDPALWTLPEHQAYAESLHTHIRYVQEAGRKLGIQEKQLELHDLSKWTDAEFPYYAAFFHGGTNDNPRIANGFAIAWLHHIHHNPHHWQHWIFPDGYILKDSSVENGIVRMPDMYIREMVADWMGAEMTYGGSWDMTKWLNKNLSRIKIHSCVRQELVCILSEVGYRYTYDLLSNTHKVTSVDAPIPPRKAISYGA